MDSKSLIQYRKYDTLEDILESTDPRIILLLHDPWRVFIMAALADLSIDDGTTPTPVTKTFTVALKEGGRSVWEERSGGVPAGFPKLTLVWQPPQRGANGQMSTFYKVNLTLEVPILKSVAGANAGGYDPQPEVSHTLRHKSQTWLPTMSSTGERTDLRAYITNISVSGMFIDMITDLNPPVS